jgi:hypothetical protein
MSRNFLTESDPAFAVVRKWKSAGLVCELDVAGSGIEIKNYALDPAGENFMSVPPEAADELSEHYDAILADLRHWEGVRERITKIWETHHCYEDDTFNQFFERDKP